MHGCGWNSRQLCQTDLVSLAKGALGLFLSLGTAVPVPGCKVGSPPNVNNCKEPTKLQSCWWHVAHRSDPMPTCCSALLCASSSSDHCCYGMGIPRPARMCSSHDLFVWARCSWPTLYSNFFFIFKGFWFFFNTFIGMEMFVIDDAVKCFINGTMKLYYPLQLGGLPIICLQEMLIANCCCDFRLSRILSIMCLRSCVSSFFFPCFSSVIIMDFFFFHKKSFCT